MKKVTTLIALFSTMCFTAMAENIPAKGHITQAPRQQKDDANVKPVRNEQTVPKADEGYNHEIVRWEIRLTFDESFADNVGPAEFLEITRRENLPGSLWETYDASEQRERADDILFDTLLNALEDVGTERVEQSPNFHEFLRLVDEHTPLRIDIENRQPDGPGTPNKLFIDISFNFGDDDKTDDTEDEDKVDRIDYGFRLHGIKDFGYRVEILTHMNNSHPIEHDITLNPFKQSFEWGIERTHTPQGLNFALEYGYNNQELEVKIRKPIGKGTNLGVSIAHNFGNGEPTILARIERRF